MTIPKSTLETWSNQGATVTPKNLREKIETKLLAQDSKIQNKHRLDIFLQGSYRNSTNIYGNSDVDVVVQHDSTFFSDISELDTVEKSLYNSAFSDASYTWDDFKSEVVDTLENVFGKTNVEIGNKSIKIDDGSYEADVVPCFQYRKYTSFGSYESERNYVEGIKFFTTNERRSIVNYPKVHYSNGATKNQSVNSYYKPTIRVFKNMKRKMIEKGLITKELAPSYFVENLLYNVPNETFNNSNIDTRVYNILKWLSDNRYSISNFVCQNEQVYLFGHTEEQWNETDAQSFIAEVINLWNEW